MKNVLERYFEYIENNYYCETSDELFGKKYVINEPLYCGNLTRIRLEEGFEISKWTTNNKISTNFEIKEVKDNILEVGYCYYGNSNITIYPPSQEYSINPGDIFIYKMLNSCERARSVYSKCKIISISMNFNVLRNAINPIWENKLIKEWADSLNSIFNDNILIIHSASSKVKAIAENIEHLSADNMMEYMRLKIKSMEFIASVISEKNQEQSENCPKQHKNSIVQQAAVIIKSDFQSVPTVSELANKLNISNYKLQLMFKKVTGGTVYEYVQKIKMEKAKLMLKETAISVLEIANELGYSNPSKFAQVFSKFTGKTPLKYRNDSVY